MKRYARFVLCLSAAVTMVACGKSGNVGKAAKAGDGVGDSGKLAVSVTFNAMKEIALAVGGDRVDVTAIVPDGMEPHDFEPAGKDMEALSVSKVFMFNGLGLESWALPAAEASGNKALLLVDASKGADTLATGEAGHGGIDPHLWLSLSGAETQARNMQKGFAEVDPANAAVYAKNADAFVAELRKLGDEYAPRIAIAKRKEIFTGHAAFAYLCRDMGISQHSVEDVFAAGEPSPRQLAELAKLAKAQGVKTIFAEELASPEVSKTLASEVGASVRTIYTMEGAEDGKSYLERMRANLEAVSASLEE